jgi:hypothetical protein
MYISGSRHQVRAAMNFTQYKKILFGISPTRRRAVAPSVNLVHCFGFE